MKEITLWKEHPKIELCPAVLPLWTQPLPREVDAERELGRQLDGNALSPHFEFAGKLLLVVQYGVCHRTWFPPWR